VGALSSLVRYDVVIYLFFWDGRVKEKLLGTDPSPTIHCQSELLRMVLLAFALHALSAYLGAAIRNTGCGRKPQNQYSIHLFATIDNGKSFISLLISNAL
jgi:hypothetical protein